MSLPLERIVILVLKHLHGELNAEEQLELEQWMSASPENSAMVEAFFDEENVQRQLQQLTEVDTRIWNKLEVHTGARVKPIIPYHRYLLYAACISAFLMTLAALIKFNTHPSLPVATTTRPVMDIAAPDSTRAFITLGNGKKLYLDSVRNGTSLLPGNQLGQKLSGSSISYHGSVTNAAPELNTITVPKGSKPLLISLPDGSSLLLNVASTASFYVPFPPNERVVQVSGEAYFDVARNAQQPFIVKSKDQVIKVLGTAFNINSYNDEATIKTTLVEGKLQVSQVKSNASRLLSAGQQLTLNTAGDFQLNTDADTDEATAWKQNIFQFKQTELHIIMRQLSRWYNVDIVYTGTMKERFFTATFSRDKSLTAVLKIMELNGINCSLHNRTITIMQ
ncbi:FecR family protein [Chitinophaga arvensicola]|uniref:FecR protein n=1 Tax=Chitinophaga arvensicola TaxID=29529 RepID=A0A1I0QXI2_9BACT|nr:FecR family protein [Chitinophaga arvensicola]SEW32523.1 FecR protein [Chitinophaga arvensicola]